MLEEGCERPRRFRSREYRVARILRDAWHDRATVIVVTSVGDECCPIRIIVGGEPTDCC
jgi:hypothetical protein